MERIKEAVEKAREDRARAGGGAPSARMHAGPATTTRIQYSQTRSAPVSPQLLREKRVLVANERSPAADAYRILRTQVLQRMLDNGWNTLAITSPGDAEGKTLTAINLAISLAKEITYTVLLVDANLRQPTVHSYFGLDARPGLSDYLTDDRPLSELLVNPAGLDRFVVLPGGQSLPNSSEMLNSPKMARLVEELKSRYPSRIVLFDLPPLLSSADALAFSPYVDAALLVLEDSKTQGEDAQHAVDLLHKIPVVGTVLNKSHRTAATQQGPGKVPSDRHATTKGRWGRLLDHLQTRVRRLRANGS